MDLQTEILTRKARELELDMMRKDNHDALMLAIGRKQGYDEATADMDRCIKDAVEKALAGKPELKAT